MKNKKNIKKAKKNNRLYFYFRFIMLIFLIMLLSIFIVSIINVVLYKVKVFNIDLIISLLRENTIFKISSISIIMGIAIAIYFSKKVAQPVSELIDATKKLSDGEFDTRINLTQTKEFVSLSKSFNKMAKDLQSIEMLQSDFVNNFSHEFKTPIVSIQGFAELLKDENLPQEEKKEYLNLIISESQRLVELSQNVLNVSKIENQSILSHKVTYNLSEQIRNIIVLLQKKWEANHNTINLISDEITINANEELMSQVWINLIDNAIKFSYSGSEILIEIKENENNILVSVSNTGNNIEENSQKHIFEKFYQGDTSHSCKGNGLGLTIVKKAVELHNGSINVQSQNNLITFTVEIPK